VAAGRNLSPISIIVIDGSTAAAVREASRCLGGCVDVLRCSDYTPEVGGVDEVVVHQDQVPMPWQISCCVTSEPSPQMHATPTRPRLAGRRIEGRWRRFAGGGGLWLEPGAAFWRRRPDLDGVAEDDEPPAAKVCGRPARTSRLPLRLRAAACWWVRVTSACWPRRRASARSPRPS
jgi:hypothetical protein